MATETDDEKNEYFPGLQHTIRTEHFAFKFTAIILVGEPEMVPQAHRLCEVWKQSFQTLRLQLRDSKYNSTELPDTIAHSNQLVWRNEMRGLTAKLEVLSDEIDEVDRELFKLGLKGGRILSAQLISAHKFQEASQQAVTWGV
ncbi:MAG: hypothetical protein Q9226_003290 [Calogaya cf. arnoldii]